MTNNFLAYELALKLYAQCETINAKHHIKDQLNRAALSTVLNQATCHGPVAEPDRFSVFGSRNSVSASAY